MCRIGSKDQGTFSKLLLEQTAEQWYVLAEGAEKYELTAGRSPQVGVGVPTGALWL